MMEINLLGREFKEPLKNLQIFPMQSYYDQKIYILPI